MKMLCTFPGKFGDLIWALPTVRALSRRIDAPVDLLIAAPFASIVPLLEHQPYLGTVCAAASWTVENTAPMTPRVPPTDLTYGIGSDSAENGKYDLVLHLGYRGWPQRALPFETLDCLNEIITGSLTQLDVGNSFLPRDLHLDEPWITIPSRSPWQPAFVCGFTDEYFELKFGLYDLLTQYCQSQSDEETEPPVPRAPYSWEVDGANPVSICSGPRWEQEAGHKGSTWEESAELLSRTPAFLGCCSALHVLAVAVGTPVVVMEPNPHRHHPIFFPLGMDGPQVTVVKGNDNQPTFDSRHCADAIHAALARRKDQS